MSVLLIRLLFCPFWFDDLDLPLLPLLKERSDYSRESDALQGRFGLDTSMEFLWYCNRGLVSAHCHGYIWYPVFTAYHIIHPLAPRVKFRMGCVGAIELLRSFGCREVKQ